MKYRCVVCDWIYDPELGDPCVAGRCDTQPQALVTSGMGAWGLPFRLGTESEILRVTLHFQAQSEIPADNA